MDVTPFTIQISDDVLNDLQRRLDQVRWPGELPHTDWDYGTNLDYLQSLIAYWKNGFEWRRQEAFLNTFAQFKATVSGVGVHFIHERGQGANPMPIIITHGWPSTFFEMYKIIPMLTDPARFGGDPNDAFDVIAPSMPGYGFSDTTRERGVDPARIGDVLAGLMAGLGYERFAAHGGDWGASITARLAYAHPDHVIGIHTMLPAIITPHIGPETRALSETEQHFLDARSHWRQAEGGYSHIQGTKPQTLSYGLNDSPVGLAAWIVEKFRTWSDCNGDVESVYTRDELLTTVMIYWVTQTINSSVRIYYESQRNPFVLQPGERIQSPTAVALFPKDIALPPREWIERAYNVQRWTEMPRGGHFAALEQPALLVEDIRAFFRPLRDS